MALDQKREGKTEIAFCHTLMVDKKIIGHYRNGTKFKFPDL